MKQILTNTFDGWLGQQISKWWYENSVKKMIWHWSKMDLYLSKHLFNDGTFGESVWKQPGDDVKQRNSSGSAKIETLKTSFKVFTKISPYQIRHRCEVKKRLEITSAGPHFHTKEYCQNKTVKTSFWMDRHIFLGGGILWGCKDDPVVGRISWVCKICQITMF